MLQLAANGTPDQSTRSGDEDFLCTLHNRDSQVHRSGIGTDEPGYHAPFIQNAAGGEKRDTNPLHGAYV
jgi:hypothetical protein